MRLVIVFILAVLIGFWSIYFAQDSGLLARLFMLIGQTSPLAQSQAEVYGITDPKPFTPRPASDGIIGSVEEVTGTPFHNSRITGPGSSLKVGTSLYDGEVINTPANSSSTVRFGKTLLRIQAESQVTFVSTLPQRLFIEQNQGSVDYATADQITVRLRSALFLLDQASAKLAFNEENNSTIISVEKGNVIISFLDENYETVRYELTTGDTGEIDFNSRTYEPL